MMVYDADVLYVCAVLKYFGHCTVGAVDYCMHHIGAQIKYNFVGISYATLLSDCSRAMSRHIVG